MIDLDEKVKQFANNNYATEVTFSEAAEICQRLEATELILNMLRESFMKKDEFISSLQSKLADLESKEEWVTNGQGEITTQPISEFLNQRWSKEAELLSRPNDHHLVAISKIRAQIEPLQKLIDHHTECHAEQVAEENAKLQKPFTHRFNNSGLHDAN